MFVPAVCLVCARSLGVTVVCKGATDVIAAVVQRPGGDSGHSDCASLVTACAQAGSPRRCGGQGDVLAGAIATFLSWGHSRYKHLLLPSESVAHDDHASATTAGAVAELSVADPHAARAAVWPRGSGVSSDSDASDGVVAPTSWVDVMAAAAFGGCLLTRTAGAIAFDALHRGMTTPDVIASLPRAFAREFERSRL